MFRSQSSDADASQSSCIPSHWLTTPSALQGLEQTLGFVVLAKQDRVFDKLADKMWKILIRKSAIPRQRDVGHPCLEMLKL